MNDMRTCNISHVSSLAILLLESQWYGFLHHRLILPILQFHINGKIEHVYFVSYFIQYNSLKVHPCFVIYHVCSFTWMDYPPSTIFFSILMLMDIWDLSALELVWITVCAHFCMSFLVDVFFFLWLYTWKQNF